MRKRVLIVIPDMNVGGITSSVLNFINILKNNGYDISFLDMSSDSSLNKIDGVEQYRITGIAKFWNIHGIKRSNVMLFLFTCILGLIKKITIRLGYWYSLIFHNYKILDKFDVVIAYRQCEPCYYFSLYCVHANIKIGMIHGNLNFMGDIHSWAKLFPEFTYLACVSNAVANGFRKAYPFYANKFVTLYNMFNVELIKQKSLESTNFYFDSNLINIVSVARQENGHKQVQRIPETCKLLKDAGYFDVHWYVVGDGPDFKSNQALASTLGVNNMITFCGALANPFPIIKHCDFLVLTSKTEAYSMVLKEALILGKPVVAMRYDGVEESFEDNVSGLISEQSVDSLSEKIQLLIANNKAYLRRLNANIQNLKISNDIALRQCSSLFNSTWH